MADEYSEFVEKFKPKLTTDDCYTPPEVYETVERWAINEYGWQGRKIVRPFWPGGDFENYDYPEGCVVIDNPPFSIFSAIVDWFNERGIDYFLFAPSKTMFGSRAKSCICVGVTVTYENGAKVKTSFVCSQGAKIRSAPTLYRILDETNRNLNSETKKHPPKYEYPDALMTAPMVEYMSKYGIDYAEDRCEHVRVLDEQRKARKGIFGTGYFVPTAKAAAAKAATVKAAAKAAAVKAAAVKAATVKRWGLSEREKAIVAELEQGGNNVYT